MPSNYKKYTPIIILAISLLLIASISYYYFYIKENYFYNKLNKDTVLKILSKSCNLSLRDYVNILNSTSNLRTLSLQEICNNNICNNYRPNYQYNTQDNETETIRLIKTIIGECVIKCIKEKDTYRLALVNLKVNDILASQLSELSQSQKSYPIFKRSLTNGVYGVESVNIYIGNVQESVNKVMNLTDLTAKTISNMPEKEIDENIKKFNLEGKDAQLYKDYVSSFLNQLALSDINNKENKESNDFPIELFNIVATLNLYKLFTLPSLSC